MLAEMIAPTLADPIRVGPLGWPAQTLFTAQRPWCTRWLRQPDGPNAGAPWAFTDEQARFMSWWYAYDERGRWLYRRGTLRRMKGWGKDPLGAVICAIEAIGPCRITHRNGTLGYSPNPGAWVQVAAVSRDQTKSTMR